MINFKFDEERDIRNVVELGNVNSLSIHKAIWNATLYYTQIEPVDKKIIISAASNAKYKPICNDSFIDVLLALSNDNTYIYVIGAKKNSSMWHKVFQKSKIAVYKCKSPVVNAVGIGIHILVHAQQSSALAQVLDNFPAVTATAESHIDVSALRIDVEPLHTLMEQSGNVICYGFCHCC